MIKSVALLFLFGTTISSSHFMSKISAVPYEIAAIPNTQSSGCPTSTELAPLICKLIQQNIELYFKPKLITPSTYISPIHVEKCDTPQLQTEIELPAPVPESRALVIPQPPELPPMTIPQFPVPVIVEEPQKSGEPCESSGDSQISAVNNLVTPDISPIEMPILTQIAEDPKPVQSEIYYTPMEIPQPPELPTFSMPDLPLIVDPAQSINAAPCPESTTKSAPELSSTSSPDFPIYFDIPSGPVLPPMEVNLPEITNNFIEYEPISVPQPPELPAFVMPDLPVPVVEQNQPTVAEPCLEDKPMPVEDYIQPMMVIPQPPELPQFVMPELPVMQVTEQKQQTLEEPCLDDKPAYELPIAEYISPVQVIPQPPELPQFVMPELPVVQVTEQKQPTLEEPCLEDKPAYELPVTEYISPMQVIPQPPELPQFVMPELPLVQVTEQKKPTLEEPCLEDKPVYELPIPGYITPVQVIPQPPELPQFVMPELTVVREQKLPIVEEPCLDDKPAYELPIAEYIPPAQVIPQPPELPQFDMPELPVVQVIEQKQSAAEEPCLEDEPAPVMPIQEYIQPVQAIPQPPELKAISMPELPVQVMYQKPPSDAEPCLEDNPTPANPVADYIQPVVTIPHAPQLPPFTMPELPVQIVEQDIPVAPVPCLEDHHHPAPTLAFPEYIQSLPTIPAAPELPLVNLPEFPVHVEIPTRPVLPPMHMPSPPKEPCATEEFVVPQLDSISIPKAPKLPNLMMPDFRLEMTMAEPAFAQPTFANEPCESHGKPVIPVATTHPYNAFFENYYPSYVSVSDKIVKDSNNLSVPKKTSVPQFFPTRNSYNLVMEHIIPNIASDRFRSLQNIDILPPSVSPCPK